MDQQEFCCVETTNQEFVSITEGGHKQVRVGHDDKKGIGVQKHT